MAVLTDDRFGILYGHRKVAEQLGHGARRLARKQRSAFIYLIVLSPNLCISWGLAEGKPMRVNVFIAHADTQNTLLVLPDNPESVLPHQFKVDWDYCATVLTSDRMFRGVDAQTIADEIVANGFALVPPLALQTS